jgi:hypothetical protein
VSLDSLLWFACDLAEATIIGLFLYRRLWRDFPVFFAYIARALIGDIGAAIVFHSFRSSYMTWYLSETIVDSILLFGVLVELAWSILRPVRASLSRRALIPVIGLILAVGAVIWPLAALPGLAGAVGEKHILVQLQQTSSILQVIFFLALIASSQFLSIGWRDRELQIATGLGLFSSVNLALAVLHAHQTSLVQYRHLFQVEIGAYICSLLYWIVSFAQKQAERQEFTPQMRSILLAAAGAAHTTRIALEDSHASETRNSKTQ